MGESEIQNALNFLRNPKTKDAALSEKISFLESKGVTSEDIAEALSRLDSGTDAATDKPSNPSSLQTPSLSPTGESEKGKGNGWLLAAGTFAGIAAGITGAGALAYNVLMPERSQQVVQQREEGVNQTQFESIEGSEGPTGRLPLEIDPNDPSNRAPDPFVSQRQTAEEIAKLSETVEKQTAALQEAATAMKEFMKEERDRKRQEDSALSAAVSTHLMNQTASLRADMVSVRRLLEEQQRKERSVQFTQHGNTDSGGNKASGKEEESKDQKKAVDLDFFRIGAATATGDTKNELSDKSATDKQENVDNKPVKQESESNGELQPTETTAEFRKEKMDTVYAALKTLQQKNEVSEIEKGSKMLTMYFSNLLKFPTKPRYRKVTTTNSGFKDSVAPLQGHKELFEAAGFTTKGSAYNFEWDSFEDAERVQVIKEVLQTVIDGLTLLSKGQGILENAGNASSSKKDGPEACNDKDPEMALKEDSNTIIK